jgi:hypothetical protein
VLTRVLGIGGLCVGLYKVVGCPWHAFCCMVLSLCSRKVVYVFRGLFIVYYSG